MQCCRCRDLCDVSRGVDDPCQSAMDVTHEHTRSSLKPDQMAGRSDSKICFGGQLVKENASVSYLGVEAFDSLHHDCRHIGFWVGCGGLLSMNVRAEDGVATLCACPENASGSCIGHKFCCKLHKETGREICLSGHRSYSKLWLKINFASTRSETS